MSAVDPILILVCDVAYMRTSLYDSNGQLNAAIGDAFKLYWHFENQGESGLPGIFLTVFLDFVLIFTGCIIFYTYYLRVHLNGRLLDVYHRITAPEDKLFLPYDNEISNRELYELVQKAEKWRGATGERRKILVYDYWEEFKEGKGQLAHRRGEKTTHVSIHTLHLDGYRELHRQFLRFPEGAVIEISDGELSGAELDRLDRNIHMKLQGKQTNMMHLLRVRILLCDRIWIQRTVTPMMLRQCSNQGRIPRLALVL